MSCVDIARELRDLAERLHRLPQPNRRNPDAYHEARSDLARDINKIADRVAKDCVAKEGGNSPEAPRQFHRAPNAPLPRQSSGREIPVEVRRRRRAFRKEMTKTAQNAVFAPRPEKPSL